MLTYAKTIKDKTGAYAWVPALKDPNTASFLGYFYAEGSPSPTPAGRRPSTLPRTPACSRST